MVRHISVFFVREDKKSQIEELVKQTRIWSEQAGAKAWTVGANCMPVPGDLEQKKGEDQDADKAATAGNDLSEAAKMAIPKMNMPAFGDFAQVLDFEDADAAAAYPHHPTHKALMEAIGVSVEKVVAIDFVVA